MARGNGARHESKQTGQARVRLPEARNQVLLTGRLSGVPEERVLPSGDTVWMFRLVVARDAPRGRVGIDTVDCAVWLARVQRSVARLDDGTWLEVEGALRRRFFKAGGAAASRVEVEVRSLRQVRGLRQARRAAPA